MRAAYVYGSRQSVFRETVVKAVRKRTPLRRSKMPPLGSVPVEKWTTWLRRLLAKPSP
jgi:hypothetical protein